MNISTLMSPAVPRVSSTEELTGKLQEIESTAAEFEGLFVSLLMKEMRNTLPEGGLFGGESSDSFGGLFDLMMGQHMAGAGSLGIAEMVKQDLLERFGINPMHPDGGNLSVKA